MSHKAMYVPQGIKPHTTILEDRSVAEPQMGGLLTYDPIQVCGTG